MSGARVNNLWLSIINVANLGVFQIELAKYKKGHTITIHVKID